MGSSFSVGGLCASTRNAAVALVALAAPPVLAGASSDAVDGWLRTRSDSGCMTTYAGGPPPTLSLEVNKQGQGTMSLLGLTLPNTMAEFDALQYSAIVTVTLNGKAIFSQKISRNPGFLRLDIEVDRLRAMTEPGELQFDFKGDGGQHDVIKYASPGLAGAVAFLDECVAN